MCDPPVNSVPLKQLRNLLFFSVESSETVALNYLRLIFDPFQSLRRNTKGSHAEGGEDAILTHYRGFVEGRATPPVGPAGF